MSANRLRAIVFSIIAILGVFLPWLSFKSEQLQKFAEKAGGVKPAVIYVLVGTLGLIILLAITGKRAKPFGIVKKIFITLLAGLFSAIAAKYLKDASTEISSPAIGLYFMMLGGVLSILNAWIPNNAIPCFLHKFLGAPKEEMSTKTSAE